MTDKTRIDFGWLKKHYEELLLKKNQSVYGGVGWPTLADQELRFKVLLPLLEPILAPGTGISILDYGCGTGDFQLFLHGVGFQGVDYLGYDFCEAMIDCALKRWGHGTGRFTTVPPSLPTRFDYIVSSGIFNLPPLGTSDVDWIRYVYHTITEFDKLSIKGFAFNLLSLRAKDQKKGWFYGVPELFFKLCFRMSDKVALLHDYGLDDFTIIVRK